jgi:hypothetical protein
MVTLRPLRALLASVTPNTPFDARTVGHDGVVWTSKQQLRSGDRLHALGCHVADAAAVLLVQPLQESSTSA